MALIDKQQIATLSGYPLQTRKINNLWYLVMIESNIPDAYFVRGKNLLLRSDVVSTIALSASDLAQIEGGDTAWGGLEEPAGFAIPTGYVLKLKPDNAKYYEATGTSIATPVGASVEVVTQTTKGVWTVQPNGAYSYVPNSGATGTDTGSYRFHYSDGTYSASTTVTFTITSVNQTQAPVPQKVTIEPNADLTFSIPSGAYNGGTCKIYKNGSATATASQVDTNSDGIVTFTAIPSSNTDTFEATWTHGSLTESPKSAKKINVRIKPSPVADSISIAYGSTYTGSVVTNDPYAEANLGFW
jgi:hypothetical protein